MKGLFIVLLGPVGVGKSSVIRFLIQLLNRRGIKAYKLYVKAFHGLSYMLWRSIVDLLRLPKDYAPWYTVPMYGYRSLARLLIIISAYIDALIFIPLKVAFIKILKFFGYAVISEEYLHASLFEYLYSYLILGIEPKYYAMFPLTVLYSLALYHRPDLVIALDADLNVLQERWKRRGYGDPQLRYVIVQQRFIQRRHVYVDIVINTSNMGLAETVTVVVKVLNRLRPRVV